MHHSRHKIQLFALAGVLLSAVLSGGCALGPTVSDGPTEPVQTAAESDDEKVVRLVKKTPPVLPATTPVCAM